MSDLGYGTRGPLVDKLKQLVSDIQGTYESFLDAQTLYQQGKLGEREFFAKMGEFLRLLASLGFLTVKVVVELDGTIGKEDTTKPAELTRPSPTYTPDMMMTGKAATPIYKPAEAGDTKVCAHCNAKIPKPAKFCTKCGKPQG